MQKTLQYQHKKPFVLDGLRYFYLKDSRELDLNAIKEHDAIVLECSDNVLSRRLLELFRSSEDTQIYLKPIVLYDRSGVADRIARATCDIHITDMDSLPRNEEQIRLILRNLEEHE